MPELPEIETIRRSLTFGTEKMRPVVGETIRDARVLWPRTLAAPALEDFSWRIQGRQIVKLGRRGKFLVIYLDQGALLFHLRMSGDLLVEPQSVEPAPHHRLMLDFVSGWRLAFNDPRKFGRVWLVEDPAEVTGSLGPDPLDPAFTVEQLAEILRRSRRQLKPLLLDQTILAGLGNIYTDEALHRAKIHPLTPANRVSIEKARGLHESIRQTLEDAIVRNGTSIDWVYRGGDFQNYLRVYQRTGEPCPVCGTPIARMVVGQRGTHYCPTCQPHYKEDDDGPE